MEDAYLAMVCHPSSDAASIKARSFPFGLVKTESDFNVGSIETDLGRLKLVVAVISVDAYPFLAFLYLGCNNRCFKFTVGSRNQEASPSISLHSCI